MGATSYLEDIQDRIIDSQHILQSLDHFAEHQRAKLQSGTLTESSLNRDIDVLRKQIVEPLRAIEKKAGADGVRIGNQLLELQHRIGAFSSSIDRILAQIDFDPGAHSNGKAIEGFLEGFGDTYRLVLATLRQIASLLGADHRQKLEGICAMGVHHVRQVTTISKRLAARERAVAELYRENDKLKKELDQAREPGLHLLDGSGYDDFTHFTEQKQVAKLNRKKY